MNLKNSILACVFLGILSCQQNESMRFERLSPQSTGIHFKNELTETDNANILDYLYFYNGGGVAVGDINNDNLVDIFVTSNQGDNKLYLNKGNFEFEDITNSAGIQQISDWNTGVNMVDINGDGLLDIYICAVVGINGFKGRNELYINNGDLTFTESAKDYNLDFQTYAASVAFFDFDNDGDLDMYLLNHAIHTPNSYGDASLRESRNPKTGDKLLRNDDGIFTDISQEAGIYGGISGYGLGIATADINNDGYTDIYVSNDFHEDDFLYINNQDGTFTQVSKETTTMLSRFSMGSDIADINNDGFVDILSLDMAPNDEVVLKRSMGDETFEMSNFRVNQLNYHYQFSRNMLHLNNNGEYFKEMAIMAGLEATDWSWSALFADFDLDGIQDVFITNGIPKRPNDLDYIKYISNESVKNKITNTNLIDESALDKMPDAKLQNKIFKGNAHTIFEDKSKDWLPNQTTYSTGAAYADLDNDGDLDLIVNHINEPLGIYKNQIPSGKTFLKINLKYKDKNPFGIGSKLIIYHNNKIQTRQLYASKGFQSSSEHAVFFGLDTVSKIDSLKVVWPDNTYQVAENVKTNQTLTIALINKRKKFNYKELNQKPNPYLQKLDTLPGFNFTHQENNFIDFKRERLIPYKISDRGPALAIGDLNNDGLDDIFIGSSRGVLPALFLQTEQGFVRHTDSILEVLKLPENITATIADINNDGLNDLIVGNAGGEFYGKSSALHDYVFYQNDEGLQPAIPIKSTTQTSIIKPLNQNNNCTDVIGFGHAVSNNFGKIPQAYWLSNPCKNDGTLEPHNIENIGMVTDAVWFDINNNGSKELIVVGEWMAPKVFSVQNNTLIEVSKQYIPAHLNGLWQSIEIFDLNNDGQQEIILGNFGKNTKFLASSQNPMRLYHADFDTNGQTESVIAINKNGKYYPINNLDELSEQLPHLKKKYNAYIDFAGQTIDQVFNQNQLKNASLLEVHNLASGYLKMENKKWVFHDFDVSLQIAPITSMLKVDLTNNGKDELLLGGNYFGLAPFHGRLGSFDGAAISSNGSIISARNLGLNFFNKAVVSLELLTIDQQQHIIVVYNNAPVEVYKINFKNNE